MRNIILFGAPGAGKGTQAAFLSERYDLVQLSTGEMLRSAIDRGLEIGKEAQTYMSRGELVPDSMVIGLIQEVLERRTDAKGFIFDGFPRTVAQAEQLDALLDRLEEPIQAVLMLEVPAQELKNRLIKRAELENRVDDQDPSVVENRLAVYERATRPVADYYEALGKLHRIDGVGDFQQVTERLVRVMESL